MPVPDVDERLSSNLRRVESLVKLFEDIESSHPTEADTLRAAVVFLHATLEDVVRSALELELPHAAPEHFSMLRFAVHDANENKTKAKDKITVSELAKHRGKTVDELIDERIGAYLKRSNFNNVDELISALKRMGVDKNIIDPHKDKLVAMMKRRHWIVHRADHDRSTAGPGGSRTQPIGVNTVTEWKDAVAGFCSKLLATLSQP